MKLHLSYFMYDFFLKKIFGIKIQANEGTSFRFIWIEFNTITFFLSTIKLPNKQEYQTNYFSHQLNLCSQKQSLSLDRYTTMHILYTIQFYCHLNTSQLGY